MKVMEVIETPYSAPMDDPNKTHYMAEVRNRGKVVYRSPAFLSREDAARDAFTNVPRAKTCSTARAHIIDGKWSDAGGFDIQWSNRWEVMGE